MDINQFKRERDEALLSLDKEKILRFCEKYQVPMPNNDLSFWAGIHKSIYLLKTATPEQKEFSKNWLISRGFNPGIG